MAFNSPFGHRGGRGRGRGLGFGAGFGAGRPAHPVHPTDVHPQHASAPMGRNQLPYYYESVEDEARAPPLPPRRSPGPQYGAHSGRQPVDASLMPGQSPRLPPRRSLGPAPPAFQSQPVERQGNTPSPLTPQYSPYIPNSGAFPESQPVRVEGRNPSPVTPQWSPIPYSPAFRESQPVEVEGNTSFLTSQHATIQKSPAVLESHAVEVEGDTPPPPFLQHSASKSPAFVESHAVEVEGDNPSLFLQRSRIPVSPDFLESQSVAVEEDIPPLLPQRSGIPKPIAIPATADQLGSPFLRAYPPDLGRFGITREVFLNFLDDLNRIAVASPPLIMVSLAANVAGLVPEPTVQLTAMGIDAAAQASMYGVSKGRTEMHLRKANKELFGPYGLKAQIAKLDVVAQLAGMPILDSQGKVMKNTTILAPADDVHELHTMSGQLRRLKTLQPWISPLEVEGLPVMEKQTNPVSKMSVGMSEFHRKQGEKSLMKSRKKGLDKLSKKQQKAQERYEKDIQDVEHKIRKKGGSLKLEHERDLITMKYREEMDKAQKGFEEGSKEEKKIRKIYFLLLTNVNEDTANEAELKVAKAADVEIRTSSSTSS